MVAAANAWVAADMVDHAAEVWGHARVNRIDRIAVVRSEEEVDGIPEVVVAMVACFVVLVVVSAGVVVPPAGLVRRPRRGRRYRQGP